MHHLNRLATGGVAGPSLRGTSVIYLNHARTVSELCDLVCARLAAQAPSGKAGSA